MRSVKSHGRMSLDTAERMIEHIFQDLSDGDELTIAFQGGEPTLAGLRYFEHVIECVNRQEKRVNVQYSIQTNGTIINQRWCDFLKKNDFLVGLSIDGAPLYHDKNRLDTKMRGTFHKVKMTKEMLDQYGIEYNVLCVLTEELSYHAKEVFAFLKAEQILFVQFIPCLDDLHSTQRNEFSLTPQGFLRFYQELLPLWIKEMESGRYISIKLFDDILNLIVKKRVTACGMIGNCQVQYVIEADGSVYPCDFYAVDEYCLGSITEVGLKELFMSKGATAFLCSRPVTALPQKCNSCSFFNMCRGGCKRMKDAMFVDEESQFCGYQSVLSIFMRNVNGILEGIQKI